MSLNADAVTLMPLAVLAALIVGIVAYAGVAQVRAGRARRHTALIRATIIEYFRRSGVRVSVDCVSFDGKRYTAVVESEPMKRFRLSHIIEMTVSEHVRKSCGLELDKIYWRFPIKDATQPAAPGQAEAKAVEGVSDVKEDKKPDEASDEYINEGLEHYRHIPKPEVEELPWETFEQFSRQDTQPNR